MADKSSSKATYILIGAIIAAVIAGGLYFIQEQNEPELSIEVNEDGIDVDTN